MPKSTTHGGQREGAGRPKGTTQPDSERTKRVTFSLYPWDLAALERIKAAANLASLVEALRVAIHDKDTALQAQESERKQ